MRKIAIRASLVLIIAAALVVSGCCCCCIPNPFQEELGELDRATETASHPAARNVTVDLLTEASYIEVFESTGPNVSVTVDAYAPRGRLDTMKKSVAFSEDNGSLRLDLKTWREREDDLIKLEGPRRFEVRVALPAGNKYVVLMDSENSAINVTSLNGSTVSIHTTNALVGIRGGDYESIDVETTNGAIVAWYDADSSAFRTTNGLIEIDAAQAAGTLRASTTNGLLSLKLKKGTGFNVDASIINGLITHPGVDIDGTSTLTRLSGKTPGYAGDFKVELTATNGNIRIGYRADPGFFPL